MRNYLSVCVALAVAVGGLLPSSDVLADEELQVRGTLKVQSKFLNPFAPLRSNRFSRNAIGLPQFSAFDSPFDAAPFVIGEEDVPGSQASPGSATPAVAKSPVEASSSIQPAPSLQQPIQTYGRTGGSLISSSVFSAESVESSPQLSASSSGRPPYRPPVRSPYRPPPRPPF